ncbi:unnamed protein product [Closterium sp. NIES-65]|nr:unnamed protein product [Closterium sp. NIES-65]
MWRKSPTNPPSGRDDHPFQYPSSDAPAGPSATAAAYSGAARRSPSPAAYGDTYPSTAAAAAAYTGAARRSPSPAAYACAARRSPSPAAYGDTYAYEDADVAGGGGLLPWKGEDSLMIDRFDVRHLLDDLKTIRRKKGGRGGGRGGGDAGEGGEEEEMEKERYVELDMVEKEERRKAAAAEAQKKEEAAGGAEDVWGRAARRRGGGFAVAAAASENVAGHGQGTRLVLSGNHSLHVFFQQQFSSGVSLLSLCLFRLCSSRFTSILPFVSPFFLRSLSSPRLLFSPFTRPASQTPTRPAYAAVAFNYASSAAPDEQQGTLPSSPHKAASAGEGGDAQASAGAAAAAATTGEAAGEGKGSGVVPPFAVPPELQQCLPPTEKVYTIMARTASFVRKAGAQAEIVLRVKHKGNPPFAFLSPDHSLP